MATSIDRYTDLMVWEIRLNNCINDTLPSPLVAIFILTRDPGASTGPLSDLLRQTKDNQQVTHTRHKYYL